MKKVFAAAFAAAIMMFSAVPAFAAVDSPVATTKCGGGGGGGTVVVKDCGVISPKTGSSDISDPSQRSNFAETKGLFHKEVFFI